jgi:beta-lactamase regulating signal transducer with metallopeptidase domain
METDSLIQFIAGWLLTYLVHSTILLLTVMLLIRMTPSERAQERLWRLGLLGALASTSAQSAGLADFPHLIPAGAARNLGQALDLQTNAGWMTDAGTALLNSAVIAWAVIALAGIISLLVGHFRLSRLLRRQLPLQLPRTRTGFSLPTELPILVVPGIQTPIALASGKVCLPRNAILNLTSDELFAVVAHEQAHIARRDPLWLLVTSIICRIFFFQPLNWVSARNLRALGELLCDALAAERTSPLAIASALATVSSWPVHPRLTATGLASPPSLTMRRVVRILQRAESKPDRRWAIPFCMVCVLGLITLGPRVSLRSGMAGIRYTIAALDNAGPFTVTLERSRVVAMTFDGVAVPTEHIVQKGKIVRVRPPAGANDLELELTANGGMKWTSRPKPVSTD